MMRLIVQHGENPEAVVSIDAALNTLVSADETYRSFAERCHRYDSGEGAA